jgi:vitamin B12 transporter
MPELRPRAIMALLLLLPAPALAQTDQAPTNQLPPVAITPDRLPTPLSQTASSVTIVTRQEIEQNGYRTVPDALQAVPGLNVVQSGGPGGQTSVFIRGTDANQVKVLIDGIDAGDPSTNAGTFPFQNMTTADIARIEVLRGPQSALYGANALGGVINIITVKGSGPAKLRADIEGGSFGTFNQSAGVSGGTGRVNYAFDIAHNHSDDTKVTPDTIALPGMKNKGDYYDNITASARIGVNVTDNFDLGFITRYTVSELKFDGGSSQAEPLKAIENNQMFFTRGTAHLVSFDGRLDQTIGLAYSRFRERDLDPNYLPLTPDYFRGDRLKLDYQGNLTLAPGQILTFGAEHQLDQIDSSGPVSASMNNDAGFVQLKNSIGDRFFNTASVRYDSNDRFGNYTSWREAPVFLIPETGTKLKASIGTGFTPPTLVQLFQNYPDYDFFGNPNLKAETSFGYDAGFEETLWHERVQFGATYFHNDIRNLIAVNADFTSYANIGKAATHGVETFVSVKPIPALTLRADYTYTIAQNSLTHEELLRRPKDKASVSATWNITPLATVSATVIYTGPWQDTTRDGYYTNVTTDGYALLNIAGSYDLGHGVTAYARIDNVTNRRYQDPLGFDRPGIGAYGGLRLALDTGRI